MAEQTKCKKAKNKYVPNATRQAEHKARKLIKHLKSKYGIGGKSKDAISAWNKLPMIVQKKFPLPEFKKAA